MKNSVCTSIPIQINYNSFCIGTKPLTKIGSQLQILRDMFLITLSRGILQYRSTAVKDIKDVIFEHTAKIKKT